MLRTKQKLLSIAKRHLDEAIGWMDLAKKQENVFVWRWEKELADAHLEMANYWKACADNVHYMPGTWKVIY